MKPVEIEFLMRDNLTAGLDKSKMSVEQLLGAARRASTVINAKIEEQRKVIDGVNSDLDRMQRKLQTMKPGAGQQELQAEISACKKVLAEETGALQQLEKEHQQAKQGVAQLEQEYRKISISEEQAAAANKSLTDKIREQKAVVKQVEADVRALQKAYEQAAPGNAQGAALAELNAAKKALEEEKVILNSLTETQEQNRESNKRLSRQLRELQNDMARMRLNGEQNTEEYRQMAQKAAQLSDTLGDLRAQTSILANDDANLQGFISGVNGLSGAFTTATGVMSLFAGENENLMKVQARVQSVMAITMGLQQVFNALNKDSAFRLVTVTKVKNLLTAANYRLATSLGISNAAATALMATLTLGLSVVITGLIVAWNKYSDAQEEAARKAQERVEIESQGRAEMIKTRFEIDTTRESLKNFTGSKEEEKKKCEEMNRKYGEAFGYYDTVAQWYDVLTQKAEQYIQMLFLQAKAQALVNKAVEADEKVNKHKATKPGNADSDMGFFARMGHYIYDGYAAIERYNKEAYDKRTKELEAERDGFLKQAADLEKQAASIGKSNNIGGHSAPDKPKKTKDKTTTAKDTKREEERPASELLALQRKNRQAEIDLLKEGSEKKRRQIRENYQKEMEELATQEMKWREAQKGHLTQEQSDALAKSRSLAAQKQKEGEDEIAEVEAKKRLDQQRDEVQAMSDYLKTYGSFQQQKLAIARETAQQIAEVDASGVSEATKKWQKAKILKEQEEREASLRFEEISRGIDWNALFSGVGNLTKEMMEPMMEQLRAYVETEDYRKADAETQQKVTDLIQEMRKYVGTDQSVTWQKLDESIKQLTDSVAAYDRAVKAEEVAVQARDEGKKRLASGDITEEEYKALEQKAEELGDATAQARENMEDFGRALNRTSDEVAAAIDRLSKRNELLEQAIEDLTDEMKSARGATAIRISSDAEKLQRETNENYKGIAQARAGYHGSHHSWNYYWGGYSDEQIARLSRQMGRQWNGDLWDLSPEEMKMLRSNVDMWERITKTGKGGYGDRLAEKLNDYIAQAGKLQEITDALYENLTTTTRENVFSDFLESLYGLADGSEKVFDEIAENWQAMVNRMAVNNLVGAKFQRNLETWYENLAKLNEARTNGEITDEEYRKRLDELKAEYEGYVNSAKSDIEQLRQEGIIKETDKAGGTTQRGRQGGFTAMSQDQGTKLEGLFISGQMHWASMDARLEDVADRMGRASDTLVRIEENTAASGRLLGKISEVLARMARDGIRVK